MSEPCKKCGGMVRYKNGACRQCAREHGFKLAISGKPCSICGSTERYLTSGNCKPCSRSSSLRRYKENPEKHNAYTTKWRKNNPEKRKAIREKYRQANPEKVKESSAKWRRNNRDKTCEHFHKRRAFKKNATPGWFGEFDKFVVQEAAHLCKLRELATNVKWEIDHIVPLQNPVVCGLHVGANIRVITRRENRSKGNRHWSNMPAS